MRVFILEFSYFDSLEWGDVDVKITAESHEQIKEAFDTRTRYISSETNIERKTREELKADLWKRVSQKIQESELKFPIVAVRSC